MAPQSGGATSSGRDKRRAARSRKRIMVRYGTSKAEKTAFTRNISESGMFLQTNAVFKPGTTIQVQFEVDEQPFTMWARVVWAKKVPPQLAHILGCGMGVCFIEPSPEWVEFFRRRQKEKSPST